VITSVIASFVFAGFALPEAAFADTRDPKTTLTIVVQNFAEVPLATLTAAEGEAGRILSIAGIGPVWLECPARRLDPSSQRHCQELPEVTDFTLLLPGPTARSFHDTVLGFVIYPFLANVYYEYAVRIAKEDGVLFEVPLILGSAIAHEIGHLLLGLNSHSAAGIMEPLWGTKQVQQAVRGTLLFTSQQSKVLRAEARTRQQNARLKPQRTTSADSRAANASRSTEP
jgi:hypothetical protein